MRYKYIMFDMDGTVLDTLCDLKNAVNHSLDAFGLPPCTASQIRSYLGSGAKKLIERAVPSDCDAELCSQVLSFYKDWYDRHCMIETAPYPGTLELMAKLRDAGCRLAIVSNKPHSAVAELAQHFFAGYLETAIGERPELRRKPWPDMVLSAMDYMGADKEQCLYIGDSEQDILTAQNTGIDCASVTWGFRDEEQLVAAGGNCLVHSMDELYDLIMG